MIFESSVESFLHVPVMSVTCSKFEVVLLISENCQAHPEENLYVLHERQMEIYWCMTRSINETRTLGLGVTLSLYLSI